MCTRGSRGRAPGKLWPALEARQSLQGPCRRCGSKACLIYKWSMMTRIWNIMTKRPSFLYTECLPGTSHGLATGQMMLIPAPHSICFLWPHLPQQPQFRFVSPSTSVKVPVSVYFSILLIFYLSFFLSDYILLIQVILIFLFWFIFSSTWGEWIFCFSFCDLDLGKIGEPRASLNKWLPVAIKILFSLHRRFLQLSTLPFWNRMHDGVHKQWVWDKFFI